MLNQSTKVQKCKIGIFGTDWDQEAIKKILNLHIADNIEFDHFSKPETFGIDHDTHPHQTCINFVPLCDLAFFFINKRYGGPYQGEVFWEERPDDWTFDLSVTHAEYRKAKIENIPVIVFIHSKAYKEIGDVFLKSKDDYKSDKERYESIKNDWNRNKHYVKDSEVYCFIRETSRGMGKNQLYQSWMVEYSDADLDNNCYNLKEKIIGGIKSLTPDIIRNVANEQYDALQNELRIGPEISYKFMNENGCLVDRKIQDHTRHNVKNPKDKIRKAPNHVMVTGGANTGKTFFMIDLFGEDVESCNKVLDRNIPIFFSFKNRTKDNFDLVSIISNEMFSHSLPKCLFNFDTVSITLYIDGIDEGGYITTAELKKNFTKLLDSVRDLKLVIALRQEYYDLNYTTFNEIFEGKITIYRLLEIEDGEGKMLVCNVLSVLDPVSDPKKLDLSKIVSRDLLHEPMHCVMAAWILHKKSPGEVLNVPKVYDYYTELLAEHEIRHVDSSSLTIEDLYKMWHETACIIARKKTKGENIDCDNLQKQLIDMGHDIAAWKRTHGSLIECNRGYARFKYDSYMNSLLSKMIIDYLSRKKGTEDVLSIDCYYDTSVFIRNRFNELERDELIHIRDELCYTAIGHVFKENEDNIRIIANCIYLLGLMSRMENLDVDIEGTDVIKRMIKGLKECTKVSYVSTGTLFALTALGDYNAENELNKELKKEEIRKRNTDFHLIYFGAIRPQRSFPPNIPISDAGIDCSRLLDGMVRHFNRKEKRDDLRIRINVTIMCDALEIYHCYYSKDNALKWIEKFEKLISSIDTNNRHAKKLIGDSKKRLDLCKERIEKL